MDQDPNDQASIQRALITVGVLLVSAVLIKLTQIGYDSIASRTRADLAQETQILSNLLTSLVSIGIIIGGIRTYRAYFTPRLDVRVSGMIVADGDTSHLTGTISVNNAGQSRVEIQEHSSALRIFAIEQIEPVESFRIFITEQTETIESFRRPQWERLGTFPILEYNYWIEPGETIEGPFIVPIPPRSPRLFRLELRIVGYRTMWIVGSRRVAWIAEAIATQVLDQNN